MARKPRIHIPSGFYHVILRGNGGQDVFYAKGDRVHLLLLLQQCAERYNYRLHAFCLMTNHIHLLIQVG
ncbi:MAG: transposase, partial [Desulfobulbaceae bacterium]|nr:transposase [Desulfobulbaceae bacterium]